MRIGRLLAIAVLVVLSLPRVAAAEDRAEPSAADIATARVALTEGVRLREKGELLQALGRIQTAFDLVPSPVTGFELGKTHMMLGHVLQAHELFKRVTLMEPRPAESERAKTSRMEAARLAPDLEPRIPFLRIHLVLPKEATAVVHVDDEAIPTTGDTTLRAVDPGTHKIIAKAGDGPEQTVTVTVAEAETKDVELSPQWVPPKVETKEPGVLYVKRTNPLTVVGFTMTGVGIVLTAVGAGFLNAAASELDDKCGELYCPPSTDRNERVEYTTWAFVTGVGALTAAAGLCAGVFGLANPIKEKVTTGASLQLGPTGATWRVRF